MPLTYLKTLWERGTDFLGSRYSILGGAMTWISDSTLVSAISNGGGFGVLACGAMSPEVLRDEIRQTKVKTGAPFGVNLIVVHPELKTLAQTCVEEGVSHVVLAGGMPSSDLLNFFEKHRIKTLAFAASLPLARKMIRMGVGGLILEGSEAGGHVGAVSTAVLAQEILIHITDCPVFIAGGIGRGETILAYLEMGAAGCQLGTRFACAEESRAHIRFKQAFIKAQGRDAILSQQLDPRFPVAPVRALVNKASQRFLDVQKTVIEQFNRGALSKQEAQLNIEHFWAGALRRATLEGDVENGSLMAGQSVGMVTAIEPVETILQELLKQAMKALEKRRPLLLEEATL